MKKNLLTDPAETVCHEPERITGQMWAKVSSQDFACKPEVEVLEPTVVGRPGSNATLRCQITGNPVPGVKWVLNGRIIQNNSAPLHTKDPDQVYVIEDLALAEGECQHCSDDDVAKSCHMERVLCLREIQFLLAPVLPKLGGSEHNINLA